MSTQGQSLKSLVEQHGLMIKVRSIDMRCPSFVIIGVAGQDSYAVRYSDGTVGKVLKEHPSTNDYVLLEK